jgi:uncharacterized protein YkwD
MRLFMLTMRRVAYWGSVAATLLLLCGPAASAAAQDGPSEGVTPAANSFVYLPLVVRDYSALPPFVAQVIALTNQERTSRGIAPLAVHMTLVSVGQNHSQDMAIHDFFSHTNPQGQAPWDRMTAAGYLWTAAAENIAAGYSTPADVMAGWMGSSGHRANILDPNLEEIGVGYYFHSPDTGSVNYTHYWTQVFGSR